jgi:hypothetical protein
MHSAHCKLGPLNLTVFSVQGTLLGGGIGVAYQILGL